MVLWDGETFFCSPGTAWRIVLQHPVNVWDIDASGHHVSTHQDPTGARILKQLQKSWNDIGTLLYKTLVHTNGL